MLEVWAWVWNPAPRGSRILLAEAALSEIAAAETLPPLVPVCSTCICLNCNTKKVPWAVGNARHLFNYDFELKASTYTLPAETLCPKIEEQGRILAFLSGGLGSA